MRLWHEHMIPKLPKNQLLDKYRECCALRGNGWNKKHKTVNYVFLYSPYHLFCYHTLIMDEMNNRARQSTTIEEEMGNDVYFGEKLRCES